MIQTVRDKIKERNHRVDEANKQRRTDIKEK
jgi:hypothetical protein